MNLIYGYQMWYTCFGDETSLLVKQWVLYLYYIEE
nr:MAG TPA: hypothetical protein [Caudoviricetes sp.]